MSEAEAFLDTNVLLYLLSADPAKADRAEEAVASGGVISVQVLNELVAVGRRKLGLTWPELHDVLAAVRASCRVVPLEVTTHDAALAIAERYGFSIYDATVLASAAASGCTMLLTEDLQDGQVVAGVTVRNPFRDAG